jgi:hypothetical protein
MNEPTKTQRRPFPPAAEASDPIFSAPIYGHVRLPVVVSTVPAEVYEQAELERTNASDEPDTPADAEA